jgi:hypothetical protein|nr:MAG TPA: hypothetical protein [Caudoviricetes sp.]
MENELYTIIEDLGKNIHVVPNCRIVPARYFDGGAEKCFFKYDNDLMVFIPNGTVLYERDFKDNPVYVLCSSVNPEDADLYKSDDVVTIKGEEYYKTSPMSDNCECVPALSDEEEDFLFNQDFCDGAKVLARDVTKERAMTYK